MNHDDASLRRETPGKVPIRAIVPRGTGHQFAWYSDSCSGVAGAPHEATFAAVNAVVARLEPPPEFICFPGDEIAGLTADDEDLRRQWRHWLDHEMAWLDRRSIALYHTTGNHTTYDEASEQLFREVLSHLPRNGPAGQEGLSYYVRRGDLMLVFVNTACTSLGGEGRVETEWLDQTLAAHSDARYRLVFGHHPAYPVNGFAGPLQRDIEPANARTFWQVLVRHQVLAYICSHILAFDVQVHDGVLQILTAGAGTAHRMPAEHEYLHCVQGALDERGLRYQVLDSAGTLREWLAWPISLPVAAEWPVLGIGESRAPISVTEQREAGTARVVAWQFSGVSAGSRDGSPQTLLTLCGAGPGLAPLWVGVLGAEQRLGVLLSPAPGRSPHLWHGPPLPLGEFFSLQLVIHTGMGPGGILWRRDDAFPWSSLTAASPWGPERLTWPCRWLVGHGQRGSADRPFRGSGLNIRWYSEVLNLLNNRDSGSK
jgi:hypothetical protein